MKKIFLILISLFINVSAFSASTYNIDARRYPTGYDVIGSWPYNVIVQFIKTDSTTRDLFYNNVRPFTFCTGTLMSPNIIISGAHCFKESYDKGIKDVNFIVYNKTYKEMRMSGTVVYLDKPNGMACEPHDYAIIKLSDNNPQNYKDELAKMRFPKPSKEVFQNNSVINIGFGALRVLSDQDITHSKEIVTDYLKNLIVKSSVSEIGKVSDAENYIKNDNVLDSTIDFDKKFFTDGQIKLGAGILDIINTKMAQEKQRMFSPDSNNAKYDNKCKVTAFYSGANDGQLQTDCMVWSGNSGGPVLINRGGDDYDFVGIMNCSSLSINATKATATVTTAKIYYDTLIEYLSQ